MKTLNATGRLLVVLLSLLLGLVAARTHAGWTQLDPGVIPPTGAPAYTFDTLRGRGVCFGGDDSTLHQHTNTYEWNGSVWTFITSVGPSPRANSSMAFMDSQGKSILFGGWVLPDNFLGDTWSWDGAQWTQLAVSGPSPRTTPASAYDKSRDRLVLFGGFGWGGFHGDTWEWNGTSWTQVSSTGPSPRLYTRMAYDETRHKVVLFGGQTGFPGVLLGDTWEWDGTSWTQKATTGPSLRSAHMMSWDPIRERVILFGGGGWNQPTSFNDLWEWDGVSWTQVNAYGPAARICACMFFDEVRQSTIVFGGYDCGTSWTVLGDLWEYRSSPENSAPVANAGPDQTIECACQQAGTMATLDGTGSSDSDGDPLTYTWTGPFEGSPTGGATPTVKLLPGCEGLYPITLVVNDGLLDSSPDTVQITVRDTTPPSTTCPQAISVEAQSAGGVPASDPTIVEFLSGASASDNCDGSPDVSHGDVPDSFPLGTTPVTFTATDAASNSSSCQADVTVQDTTPPSITVVSPQPDGLYVAGGLTLDFSATDLVGTTELTGRLEDPAGVSRDVSPGFKPGAGVYTLEVTAADAVGNRAEIEIPFVVYDPAAGFVTGGGWIQSPAGAYKPDPALAGKANFGFVSKYNKHSSVPEGQTEFVFHAGGLDFHSSVYEWLVVTGSNYARFKGTGTLDGTHCMFMLWAADDPDTLRIRIWTQDAGGETDVYDNGFDQPTGGGSIVVHAR